MLGLFSKNPQKKEVSSLSVKLHNTKSGTKEVFQPLKPSAVTIYSCGPTVYDYAHIGNLRSYVFSDILKRVLSYNNYQVKHVINFTDFGHLSSDADEGEDKMMRGLKREDKPFTLSAMRELSDTYIDAFVSDIAELNILPPSEYTRASDFVREQIELIKTLEEKGYTYETSDGLYFEISKFPSYGELGNIKLDALKEGARVEVNPEKHHPADFALWKKGLLGWDSAWGKGFPGWHTECVAMIFARLGKQIDIHTGGIDHVPIHHNCEIAQAEAATGRSPYVRYWLHNAHLKLEDQKISKSLGNGIGLRQLIERGYRGDTYRYWLLTAHYRSPINFTFEALDAAKQALFRLKRYIYEDFKNASGAINTNYQERFHARINDDLDTPGALAIVWELVKDATVPAGEKVATLKDFDRVLAIGLSDEPDTIMRELGVVDVEDLPAEVQQLLEERELARAARNWDEADRIREAINLRGYSLEDTPQGPKVSKN